MTRSGFPALWLGASLFLAGSALAAPISVTSTGAFTGTSAIEGPAAVSSFLPDPTFPASTTLAATNLFGVSASTTLDFQDLGSSADLYMSINHAIITSGPPSPLFAQGRIGGLTFTADSSADYDISGGFQHHNIDVSHTGFSLFVTLMDLTTGSTLFEQQEGLFSSFDTLITVGVAAGPGSIVTGDLTGTLIAGHDYEYSVFTELNTGGSAAAFATGEISLAISGDTVTVSEPGAFAILGIGLAGMIIARRRRAV